MCIGGWWREVHRLLVERTAGPSTSLRSGRDENFSWAPHSYQDMNCHPDRSMKLDFLPRSIGTRRSSAFHPGWPLFGADRSHRVDRSRPPRWVKTRQRRHHEEDSRGDKQHCRSRGPWHGWRLPALCPESGSALTRSPRGGGTSHQRRLQHHANHACALRAKRHPHSEFPGFLRDGVGDYAVDSGGGEGQRQHGKQAEERSQKFLPTPRVRVQKPAQLMLVEDVQLRIYPVECDSNRTHGGFGVVPLARISKISIGRNHE